MSTHPAVEIAKQEREQDTEGVRTLSTGVRARILSVSQAIIQDALSLLDEPKMPMWVNEEKGREEENPNDPDYLRALEDFARQQYKITFDTYAMFGLELIDGLPEDDSWLKRLRLLDMRGILDLSDFDLDDEIHKEFLYKRYIALGNDDYVLIGVMSGINPAEVRRAAASFPGNETSDAD